MPLVGVTVIVPSFKVGHEVGVEITFAVNGVLPAATLILTEPVQPKLSVNTTVCGPAGTLVNTLPGCGGPPSNE